jgi:hypothetical protein
VPGTTVLRWVGRILFAQQFGLPQSQQRNFSEHGFVTMREAADQIAVAMYGGEPDRPVVKQNRDAGFDVSDSAGIEDAVAKIWAAVDRGGLEAFVTQNPLQAVMLVRVKQRIFG